MTTEKEKEKKTTSDVFDELPLWAQIPLAVLEKFGVSTVIVLAILYAAIFMAMPEAVSVVNRYCDAVSITQDMMVQTQKDIAESQKTLVKSQESLVISQEQLVKVVEDVSRTAAEIIAVERDTKMFMEKVQTDHVMQLDKLNTIEGAVSKPAPSVDVTNPDN